jgi:hypothetical protein
MAEIFLRNRGRSVHGLAGQGKRVRELGCKGDGFSWEDCCFAAPATVLV